MMDLITFNKRFTGPKADATLCHKLEAELPGILAWAVRVYLDWQKNEPRQISHATSD
jgi:phage/plasmid-associated DNA primase